MLGVSADDKHCVTVDGKVVAGRRLSTPPSSGRAQASPTTRPEQPSLASVGGGIGRWCRIRAPSSGRRSCPADAPRVRPIFLRRDGNANVPSIHATSRQAALLMALLSHTAI